MVTHSCAGMGQRHERTPVFMGMKARLTILALASLVFPAEASSNQLVNLSFAPTAQTVEI